MTKRISRCNLASLCLALTLTVSAAQAERITAADLIPAPTKEEETETAPVTTPAAPIDSEVQQPSETQDTKLKKEKKHQATIRTELEPQPKIEEERILFVGGKSLAYSKHRVIHKNSIDAYRKHEPIFTKETPVIIESWKRVVLIKYLNYFEGGTSEIYFYDYQGELLSTPVAFKGNVIIAEPTGRVLLGQKSRQYRLDKSFLLNTDGKSVKTITQPLHSYKFGSSKDGEVFWILSRSNRNGHAITLINVIDRNGEKLHFWDTDKAQKVGFDHKGKYYEFEVGTPQVAP